MGSQKEPKRKRKVLHTGKDTRVDQSQAAMSDIGVLVRQAEGQGGRSHLELGPEMYGDFSAVPTFHEAYTLVHQVTEEFMSLPSDVRGVAQNDPLMFVELMATQEGRERLQKAGLVLHPGAGQQAAGGDPPAAGEASSPPQPTSSEAAQPSAEQPDRAAE